MDSSHGHTGFMEELSALPREHFTVIVCDLPSGRMFAGYRRTVRERCQFFLESFLLTPEPYRCQLT